MAVLYLTPTPLGNLDDLTPRAAAVLARTSIIAAESISRARQLLSYLGLTGKTLISCREDNRARSAARIVENLDRGQDVALISDAGTPGICDPGGAVVKAAAGAGHRVCPLPGPSALTAAVAAAGLEEAGFCFLGFLPAKPGPRQRKLLQVLAAGWPLVFFEAPHRIKETALDLARLAPERRIVWLREISKLNEEIVYTIAELFPQLLERAILKGEMTLVVEGAEPAPASEQDVDDLLRQGLAQGTAPSALARQTAKLTGWNREQLYRRLLYLSQQS